MPRGVYPRKGNPELAALTSNPESQTQATLCDLELRIASLERRQAQMEEAFAKGYMPSPGGLIGGSRGP